MSLQEVQNEMPHHKSLIQEMMAEEYDSIIQCPGGKIHFWSDGDMILIQPKTEAMKGHSDAR